MYKIPNNLMARELGGQHVLTWKVTDVQWKMAISNPTTPYRVLLLCECLHDLYFGITIQGPDKVKEVQILYVWKGLDQ